ncbi:MAG: Txe/YoeB family addiction module toxin [Armatimonadetes bacterium]|nr:Txe/YoeB family addiction module toxin [Armatimonadota bacterium]MBS1725404.1 Txe/YoeB family addiction module toxin [Armatimonadota bacterium]
MNVKFSPEAWEEYVSWQQDDLKKLTKISRFIAEIKRTPYEGLGSPEALRHELSGWWSRRIDQEQRLVYRVENDCIEIVQCRYHY